jgi:hypothetical protein
MVPARWRRQLRYWTLSSLPDICHSFQPRPVCHWYPNYVNTEISILGFWSSHRNVPHHLPLGAATVQHRWLVYHFKWTNERGLTGQWRQMVWGSCILSLRLFTVANFSMSSSETPSDAKPICWENSAKLGSARRGTWPRSSWIQSLEKEEESLYRHHVSESQVAKIGVHTGSSTF